MSPVSRKEKGEKYVHSLRRSEVDGDILGLLRTIVLHNEGHGHTGGGGGIDSGKVGNDTLQLDISCKQGER